MNPTFTVSIDLAKRKTSVTGLVAVGEKVNVVISGFGDYSVPEWEPDNTEGFSGAALRFRLVTPDGKDLVRFPLAEGDAWNDDGDSLSAEIDFNTMQLRKWLRGFPIDGKAEVGVIVDSVVDAMEYGRGTVKILQWAASPAEDPTILPDWRKTLRDLNAAIVEISSKSERAESAAQTAEEARDDAQASKESAETAANNALSSENAAKGFKNNAESASARASTSAEEAKASQTAAESAKSAAESARDEAREYAESAESVLASAATKAELEAEVERATAAEEKNAAAIDETGKALVAETERAKTAEQNLANEVSEVGDKVDTLVADDVNKSARTIAAEEVAKVVANAPADLDTLKEIADYIESDKTGASEMVTQIDANAKAISAEVTRAKDAEAALGEEIDKKVDAEEGKGLSTEDYTTEDKDKLGGIEAGAQVNPDLSGYAKKVDLPYRLIEQPAGDVQLQNRSMTHLTDANITHSWSARASEWNDETMEDITHEATDVGWIKKETHDFINEGDETFVARFPWLPGFLMPITGVADVDPDIFYNISEILDEHGNYIDGFIEKVDCVVESVVYGVLSYCAYSPETSSSFVMTKEEGGDVFQGSFLGLRLNISYNEEYGAESYWYADDIGYDDMVFADDLVPPEVGEHPDGYWQFELGEDFKELPKPGETFSCYVYWNDGIGEFTGPRYRVDITLPADMPDFELTLGDRSTKASCIGVVKNSEGKISLDLGEVYVNWYREKEERWDDTIGDYTYTPITRVSVSCNNYTLQKGVSVFVEAERVRQGSEMEDSSVVDVGQKVTITATDSNNLYLWLDTSLRVTEKLKFSPPEPTEDNGARDLMLCVDLEGVRTLEIDGVTEVEEDIFSLPAGRTLISITEPVSGELYASTRSLPKRSA